MVFSYANFKFIYKTNYTNKEENQLAYNSKRVLRDSTEVPIPQVYNQTTDSYEPMQGSDGAQHVKIIGGSTINATLGDQQAKTINVTLQNAAASMGVGSPFSVGAYKTLTIEITGTSTGRTISFEGSSVSGAYYPIQGVRLSDLSFGTSTTGNNEVWTFDITGLTNFRTNITSVAGGNVTVNGKAVA
jgi:hypothetical protein